MIQLLISDVIFPFYELNDFCEEISLLDLASNDYLGLSRHPNLIEAAKTIRICQLCGNLDTSDICKICLDDSRDKTIICVVEDISDLWALERTSSYKGLYHVLGGVLSAIDGINAEDLRIQELLNNIKTNE